MTTPLEAARPGSQKYEMNCDIVYESFMNGQNTQFMEQIVEYRIDISFLLSYIKNYYGEIQSNEVARRYASLAQGELDRLRYEGF